MKKKEFLDTLKDQLSGHLPEQKVYSHIKYYQEYIETQIKNGSTEEAVLEKLGSPLLIAKTLLDTAENDDYYMEQEETYGYETPSEEKPSYQHKSYKLDLTTWYGKAIVIILAVLVIIGLFIVIGTLLPIVAVIALVLFVYSKIRKS